MPRKRPIVTFDSNEEDNLHRQPLKMIKTQLQDNRDHRERLQSCMDELYGTCRVGPPTIALDSSCSSDKEEEGEAYVPSSHDSDELDSGDEGSGGEGSEVNRWESDIDKSGELGEQGEEDDTKDNDEESQKVGEEGARRRQEQEEDPFGTGLKQVSQVQVLSC